jgi:hypothetical protein
MSLVRSFFLAILMLAAAAAQAQDAAAPDPAVPAAEAVPALPSGPDEVTVGVYVNDIQQLDLQSHSYAMDFYVWLRWKNPGINPAAKLEYVNPFQLWGHINTPLYDEPQTLPDGSIYMAIRCQGQFTSKLPLERYPFDTQNLIVQFEDSNFGAGRQIFVPDAEAIILNPEMTLPGYIIGKPTLTVESKPYPTNFGGTGLTAPEPVSRVTFDVPVHRPALASAIKIILPIFLAVICSAFVFFVHPAFVGGRIGLGVTAFLTLAALRQTTNSLLPGANYLTMIDMLYFAAFLYVIAGIGQAARSSWAAHRGDDLRAILQDRRAFGYLSLIYVLANAAIMWLALPR